MPTLHQNAAVPDFEVEQAVKIGLDVLSPEERRIVEDATKSKARFLELIADPKNVERLRPTAPYYMLKITPRIRLIYTREDDRLVVLDMTNQGFIDWWASLGSGRSGSPPRNAKRGGSKKSRQTS